MSTTLRLAEAEFYVLWTDATKDVLPAPFCFVSKAETAGEFDDEKDSARAALREKIASADGLIEAIVRPDLFIALTGWDETDPRKPDSEIRVLATRKGPKGYVVTQLPGESFWHGGGYTVTACDPVQLADEIVKALPDTGAGQWGDIVLPVSAGLQMDFDAGRSLIRDTQTESVHGTAKKYLRAPATGAGKIRISQGMSVFGPRGCIQHVIDWRDVESDGRYVVSDQNAPVARPADAKSLVGLVNTRVAQIVHAIKEERRY